MALVFSGFGLKFNDSCQIMGVECDATHSDDRRGYREPVRMCQPATSWETDAELYFKGMSEVHQVFKVLSLSGLPRF